MRWSLLLLLAALPLPDLALAQCPDGTPLPCEKPRPKPPDPSVIAIFPFRTAGDSTVATLREGLVELVSGEFLGDGGPRAVEPGEVSNVWRQARRGPAPTSRDAAERVARELGAGLFVFGSVVGTAARFRVTATLATTGQRSGDQPVVVNATWDSLPRMIADLAGQISGRSAGVWKLSESHPGTTSNEAVRAYMQGARAYRQRDASGSRDHYRHALSLDSTFVLAAYRLVLSSAVNGDGADGQNVRRLAWKYRRRLNADQRLLLEAIADSSVRFTRGSALSRLEPIIHLIPRSAEALNILADNYFHVGALNGYPDALELSKRTFQRALDLDTFPDAISHLAEIAYLQGDVRALRAFAKADAPWPSYMSALLSGTPAERQRARRSHARELSQMSLEQETPEASFVSGASLLGVAIPGGLPPSLRGIIIPQSEQDSLFDEVALLAATEGQRTVLRTWRKLAAHNAGRPDLTAKLVRQFRGTNTIAADFDLLSAMIDDSAAIERLFAQPHYIDSLTAIPACEVALARLRREDTTGVAALLTRIPPGGPFSPMSRCRGVVRGVHASLVTGSLDDLVRADSLMRGLMSVCCDRWNLDVAFALARHGRFGEAAAAARRRWHGAAVVVSRLAISLRYEGKWAALAGDTASAIRAYNQYLLLRQTPEPSLIPERDSVRVELALLQRRRLVPEN